MPSPRYKDLSRRITELRKNLLPAKFDPLGLYTDRVYERTRGFRVLAHAEFESYIEDRAIEVVHRAHVEWKSSAKVRPCLLALMSHGDSESSIPESLSELADSSRKYPTLIGRIETAKKHYSAYVRTRNNGIKEKNLLLLLLPLGVAKNEIDLTWLNTTEAWATSRGEVAHTSAIKMQVQIDPRIELQTVRDILDGFRVLDKLLEKK
ncbi:hypothetical protein OG216_22310 [Streptomycetaceae bacterium NBC_01309]